MNYRVIVFSCGIFLSLALSKANAANHYVYSGATGSGNGSDWTNAYTAFPSPLVRGDTYYIAAGSYGGYTFNTPASGTTFVYLKKATVSDHGTSTGWNDSFGNGQAVFSGGLVWTINMDYLSVDGATGAGTSGYGIKLFSPNKGDSTYGIVNSTYGSACSHLIFKHLEVAGVGPGNGNFIYGFKFSSAYGTRNDNQFLNCYIHDMYVWIETTQNNDILIDHCYFKNAGSSDGNHHCAGLIFSCDHNYTLRYSVLENLLGTANTTYVEPQAHPGNVYIYGNVYRATSAADSTTQWSALSLTATDTINGLYFYNNTIYGLHGANPGVFGGHTGTSANVIVRNNLWQGCQNAPSFGSVNVADHNILNTGGVTLLDPANGVFLLAAHTSATGIALSAPFNVDPDGRIRGADGTWDIGAYEYSLGGAPNPSPTPAATPSPTPTPGTPTPSPTPTPTVTPSPTPVNGLSFSATSGAIVAPFVSANGNISQSIDTQSNMLSGGRATYNFSVTESGSYAIQLMANAPGIGGNSCFINIDADPSDPLMICDIPVTSGFENRLVSWRGSGTSDVDEFTPKIFNLTPGVHQLIILGRESGLQLQWITLMKLPMPPSGLRPTG